MNRRQFGGAVVVAAGSAAARAADDPAAAADKFQFLHGGRRPEVGMLVYPGLTLLDMLGPQTVLSTSCNVHLVWKTNDLIESDTGVGLRPTGTLADCPKELDALFVGGGAGQVPVMTDPAVIGFVADRGARAKWVTSVCSGSLITGAAGLLKGYKATSHWACRDALPLFGAEPVDARVVVDRNRVSGGGVTAGLDFALVLLAKLLGEEMAKTTQLAMEYDPHPPFDCGTPAKAGPGLVKKVRDWMGPVDGKMRQACLAAAKAMPK